LELLLGMLWMMQLLLLLQLQQLLQQWQVDAAWCIRAAQELAQQLLCCWPLVTQQLARNGLQANNRQRQARSFMVDVL
jgi:hypothetical protein